MIDFLSQRILRFLADAVVEYKVRPVLRDPEALEENKDRQVLGV